MDEIIDEMRNTIAAQDAEIARLNQQLAMRIEIAESVAEELAGLGVDTGNSWDYARAAKETIEDLCAKITRLKADLDDAVSMIRCYGEILVNAGYPSGDRVVTRENIKRVIATLARVRGQRDELARAHYWSSNQKTPSDFLDPLFAQCYGLRLVGEGYERTVEEIGS